jgi:hypothetical protein
MAATSMIPVQDHSARLNAAERALAPAPEGAERATRSDEEDCHMVGK